MKNFSKNKTILVTGSAGFIGFHTSKKLLEEGNVVIGIDNLNNYYDPLLKTKRNKLLLKNKNYFFHKINICDIPKLKKVFNKYKIDQVCHLAAQVGVRYSLTHPSIYERTNIKGFINIMECIKQKDIKDVIYASSSSVYGDSRMPKKGFSEKSTITRPISIYGATKKADELISYYYHKLYGINCTGLRFFTVYGPWGRPDMAYFNFAKAITENKQIDVYNYGKMRRDFTYIDDIVVGIIASLKQHYPFEIINLGNSKTVKLIDFINSIEIALGRKAKLNFCGLQPGDMKETYANINKARRLLKFHPTTDIKTGIVKFIDWYKEYQKSTFSIIPSSTLTKRS